MAYHNKTKIGLPCIKTLPLESELFEKKKLRIFVVSKVSVK